jgi:SAM-dependent methyltransferase
METRRIRLHDWVSLVSTISAMFALAALATGRGLWAAFGLVVAAAGAVAARSASQRHPAPMPYSQRWVLFLPRWPISARRLRRILEPRAGERMLEVGPGVGIYSLPIAAALAPNGSLDAFDVQPEMLADLMKRARRAGMTNVVTTQGDAQRLPYPDRTFDAAYLVGVLGEIPDPAAALSELRRVLKPEGRLVVGEALVVDPDGVRFPTLCEMARRAGFALERRSGLPFVYFARFRYAKP